ncbi:MAG: amidohydrolase family protein [Candidatus Sericytochromatia bacterium]|nr:amidohydrolase family protein [Candidatus Sericytochromatia bacterium]
MNLTQPPGLFVDFHAHLRGSKEVAHPAAPHLPLLRAFANVFEPVLAQGVEWMARYGRHRALTRLYPHFKVVGFNEILRQFNRHQADALVASMDQVGIQTTVICAIEPFFETLDLLETLAPYGERFAVFCSVDPQDPDFAARFATYVATGQVYGLKIHPSLAGPIPTSERMFELLSLADAHHLPVIIHTGTFPFPLCEGADNALALEPVIRDFPNVPIVLAHIGWDQAEHVLALGHDYPNVYTDTSWQPPHVIREAISAMGLERVLFGSDFPLFSQSRALSVLLEALRPEELATVGRENARRLLAHARAGPGAAAAP